MKASSRLDLVGPMIPLLAAVALAVAGGGHWTGSQGELAPGIGSILEAIWGGDSTPGLAHAICGLLAIASLAWILWCRRVVQTPSLRFFVCLMALMGLLGASVLASRFTFVSLSIWAEWLAYAVAAVAVVAVIGRDRGPRLFLWVLVGAVAYMAIRGVIEYGYARAEDPSWRIFAGWVNPNAVGGMLLLGWFPALALVTTEDRVGKVVAGALAVLIGLALVLTQSKGSELAAIFGLLTLIGFGGAWAGWRRAAPALIPVAVVVVLALAIALRPPPPGGAASLDRVMQSSSASEQSAGFRINLWKSAAASIQERPIGTGLGTFRFESARPGIVPLTVFAHESWLQLAAEASPFAAVLAVAMLVFWLVEVLRAARSMPAERNLLRGGVLAAIVASCVHSFIDSDLYYFGIGFVFFALLGCGLQLSADGSGPELLPRGLRRAAVVLCLGSLSIALAYFGVVDAMKSRVRYDFGEGQDLSAAKEGLESLVRWAWFDGEPYAMRAALTGSKSDFEGAVRNAPNASNYRALAQHHLAKKEYPMASLSLNEALKVDPNNMPALWLLMVVGRESGDAALMENAARRLVSVESKPYFTVRALPELIPTQTYEARLVLASTTGSHEERVELLAPAFEGFLQYFEVTAPRVETMAKAGYPFAGETQQDVEAKRGSARQVAELLAESYLKLGRADKAAEVDEKAKLFAKNP